VWAFYRGNRSKTQETTISPAYTQVRHWIIDGLELVLYERVVP
jgi:hypothetical protein